MLHGVRSILSLLVIACSRSLFPWPLIFLRTRFPYEKMLKTFIFTPWTYATVQWSCIYELKDSLLCVIDTLFRSTGQPDDANISHDSTMVSHARSGWSASCQASSNILFISDALSYGWRCTFFTKRNSVLPMVLASRYSKDNSRFGNISTLILAIFVRHLRCRWWICLVRRLSAPSKTNRWRDCRYYRRLNSVWCQDQ